MALAALFRRGMPSSRIDDYRGLDGPFGIRALSVGILEHQDRAEPLLRKE